MAERVEEPIAGVLADGEQGQDELREAAEGIGALQGQMAEWIELHHLLHKVHCAFVLFQSRLTACGMDDLGDGERQVLLQDWRLCQSELDALADFAAGIECIGRPFWREGRKLYGEHWAVKVIALQLLFEDALLENDLSTESLFEMAEEFNTVCYRYLVLADRKLLMAVDELRWLSARLLGGME